MQELIRRYGKGLTYSFVALTFFWLVILVILPDLTMLESSFRPYLPVTEVGGPKDVYSFNNYLKILGGEVDMSIFGINVTVPPRVKVFLYTIYYSAVVTFVTFLMAYPLAYYLAKVVSPRLRRYFWFCLCPCGYQRFYGPLHGGSSWPLKGH